MYNLFSRNFINLEHGESDDNILPSAEIFPLSAPQSQDQTTIRHLKLKIQKMVLQMFQMLLKQHIVHMQKIDTLVCSRNVFLMSGFEPEKSML